jgi:hypothetical protein
MLIRDAGAKFAPGKHEAGMITSHITAIVLHENLMLGEKKHPFLH